MNSLTPEQLQAMLPGIFTMAVLSGLSSLLSIGIYIVSSLSMHAMAKRRFIDKPWLAWIPIGNLWILGSIADHYQLCAKGRVKARRKVLLLTWIVMMVITVAMMILGFQTGKALLQVIDRASGQIVGNWFGAIGSHLIWFAALYLLLMAAAIVQVVFAYICYYDLFASCDPGNAVLYLVLSIVFPVVLPVFLFACRHKEKGLVMTRRIPENPVI